MHQYFCVPGHFSSFNCLHIDSSMLKLYPLHHFRYMEKHINNEKGFMIIKLRSLLVFFSLTSGEKIINELHEDT